MKPQVAVLALLFLTISCNTTEPPAEEGPKLGKRDYVWSTDTLSYPGSFQTNMRSVYGTASNNVYIVGHNDLNRGNMYHYDGQLWRPVAVTVSEGGPIQGAIDLNAIHGSSANDIWAVGEETYWDPIAMQFSDSSLIIRFDGTKWRKVTIPKHRALWCVWAMSPTRVWAGGSDGAIFGFDGVQWTKYELGAEFFFSSIAGISPTEVYAMGHRNDSTVPVDSSGSFLFRFDGIGWQIIDSVMRTPGAPPARFGIGVYAAEGYLYTTSPNVYRREGTQWVRLVIAEVGHMSQSSPQNIIAVGRSVYHFNGIDWKNFTQLYNSPALWSDCYTDGNEVFIVGNNNRETIVVHGK